MPREFLLRVSNASSRSSGSLSRERQYNCMPAWRLDNNDRRVAAYDVGASDEMSLEGQIDSLSILVTANSRRVQQALRVLEEFARMPGIKSYLAWADFKQARFSIYTLEQKLLSRLLRREQQGRISGLYVIIDTGFLEGRSPLEAARQAIAGGAHVIQLRDKLLSRRDLMNVARELQGLCTQHDIPFIVNDYLDVALIVGADGLHVGQKDLPLQIIRSQLPSNSLAGCSAATLEEAYQAESEGADYIAVGSVFPTLSKADARQAGLEILHKVKKAVSLPVVAIGGIDKNNVDQVLEAGADAVAVISAVLGEDDIEAAARQLAVRIEEYYGNIQ